MPKVNYQINPACERCPLHLQAHKRSVCLKGKNTDSHKKLMVFTDHPNYFADHAQRPYAMDSGRLLDWMFQRMSVDPSRVAYDYTLRCYPKKSLPGSKAERAELIVECNKYRFASIAKVRPKAIVTLGQVSLEAFTGKGKVGDHSEHRVHAWEPVVNRIVDGVHVGYSLEYCLISPSDSVQVFRTLWNGAVEAGLKPKLNPKIPPFHFPTRMS